MSACVVPVKFWKPGMMPPGMPVSRIARRSARSALNAARFGNTPGVQHRQELGRARGGRRTARSPCPSRDRVAFHWSFLAHRHDHLVERAGCRGGTPARTVRRCTSLPSSRTSAFWRCADAQTPIDRAGRHRVGRRRAVASEAADRHLDRDRVHVERAQRVDAAPPPGSGSGAGSGTGAAPARSNTAPRSTKKPSSRWPAKTLRSSTLWIAEFARST